MEEFKTRVRQSIDGFKQKWMARIQSVTTGGADKEGEMEKKVSSAVARQWGMSMASAPYRIPQSGMDRAESMEYRRFKSEPAFPAFCSTDGKSASIGSMERGILGAQRDEFDIGGHVLPSRSMFMYEDPTSFDADATTKIWNAQVTASNGFFDGDREVYVNEDAATVWD